MPTPKSPKIELSIRQQAILENLSRRRTAAHREVQRARIILLASEGFPNTGISHQLSCTSGMVKHWRDKWLSRSSELKSQEDSGASDRILTDLILVILQDEARSGAPATYSAEDYCQIMALALEKPEDSGYPISHWTSKELMIECHKRGIAKGISQRQVGRFLKKNQI